MFNYELPIKTDLTLQFLNGTGLIPANKGNFDKDKFVNIFGRVSQDLAEPLRVGGLAYFGKEQLTTNGYSFINKVNMFGGDFTITLGDFLELNYQYIHRKDGQPDSAYNDIKSNLSMIELIFTPKGDESKWYAAALFNYITSDYSASNYKTIALNAGYLLRRNLRLVGELQFDLNNKTNQIYLGFVTAF